MSLEYGTIGMIAWGSTCLCGLIILYICRQKPSNGLGLIYAQYLMCHVVLSILLVIKDTVLPIAAPHVNATAEPSAELVQATIIVDWVVGILLLLGATVYWRLGIIWLSDGDKFHVHFWVKIGFVVFTVMILMHSVSTIILNDGNMWMPIATWVYYSVFALTAMIGLGRVMYYSLNFQFPSEERVTRGSLPCEMMHSSVLIFTFLGIIVGMLDFQLPYFAAVLRDVVSLWQVGFLTRILDCIFYIPTFICGLLWLDNPCNLRLKDRTPLDDQLISKKLSFTAWEVGETNF